MREMKVEEYRRLYNMLCEYEDVKRVHIETGLDEEFLLVIYTQRISRDIIRNYYKVKAYTKKMTQDWKRGQSFMSIAHRWHFSPILTAYFIMLDCGMTRKRFWSYVRDPKTAPDARLRQEFSEIADMDMVYSPKGMEIQYARGRWGEERLADWLRYKGLGYRTEKDIRGKSSKTPDCLLDKPFEWNGVRIEWIESKAVFGDEVEFRRHSKKQLKPYTQMFGNGIVVYWFGFTDNLIPPDGVFVVDGKFFEVPGSKLPNCGLEGTVLCPPSLVGAGTVKIPLGGGTVRSVDETDSVSVSNMCANHSTGATVDPNKGRTHMQDVKNVRHPFAHRTDINAKTHDTAKQTHSEVSAPIPKRRRREKRYRKPYRQYWEPDNLKRTG